MEGSKTEEDQRGIIPRTFEHVIRSIEGKCFTNFRHTWSELYGPSINALTL